MKTSPPQPVSAEIVSELKTRLSAGSTFDDAISMMRASGLDKIDCIKLLRDHAGLSLHDAKDVVHLSPAWSDRYESDERFHDQLEQAAESLL